MTEPAGAPNGAAVHAGGLRVLFKLRHVPFLVVVLLCALSPILPHAITPVTSWWLVAWGFLALMVITGWLAETRRGPGWTCTVAPLLLFPAIAALRAADGNSAAGFTPLLFLPVVWFALYGTLREVLLGVAAAVATLVLPIIIVGSPEFPDSSWRGTVLFLIVLTALGPLIHGLVESARQSTTRLATSETQFRAAFENAPTGMALMGLSGDTAMHFVRVNKALCLMLGRSEEELTSVPVTAFTHPADILPSERRFAESTLPNSPERIEKRYLHSSGRTVWAAVSFSTVRDDAGQPLHLVSQIEDISARHESDQALLDALETERAATERMRELERSRSELIGTVSHDLRTPITAAAGFSELLADGAAGPLNPEQAQMLNTVMRSLHRLSAIVDDLLTLAHAEGEVGAEAPAVPLDIGRVVDGAIQSVQLQADLAGVQLTCDSKLDGVRVSGDPDRLERVLVNLLGNAVKFTMEAGRVAVTARPEETDVVIEIADTGIGIPPEQQERIFERFYRSPMARERAISGTGLGLAIVRAIVAQHGGTVTVRSAPGEGSTFVLTLPLAPN